MNKYHVYYRHVESHLTDYCVVVTNSIQSAIDNALEDIEINEHVFFYQRLIFVTLRKWRRKSNERI